MLTPSEFESAVKDALRHYTQADLLVGNALLQARLLRRPGSDTATPQSLRTLLAETAKTLFASERDQRVYRVLELTYLNRVPKQEAAAERLGLSFSTYRRHLTVGVDRLIEWLWRQEQEAWQIQAVPEHAVTSATEEIAAPPIRPRLSIVILPFLNLSQDPSEDYFVDGICDSLITDLSRALPGSFVISRSTAFTYKGRQVPVPQIGQELGVRYVLEGSVLVESGRVRVNVQLIDALTDEHLWAERFDKERRDILRVQDEIVARLSRSVGIEMVRSEAARGNSGRSGGDVIDLVMRARSLANDVKRRENAASAVELFRKALDLDPDNVDALVGGATLCSYQVLNLYRLDDRDALLTEAEALLSRAAALAPEHTGVLKARALLLRARGRFAEAVTAITTVIARNPGEPTSYKEMGLNKLYLGATEEAADWFRRADAIAPHDPDRWTWAQGLGRALMQLGHDADAVDALSQAMESNPSHLRGKAWLAAAEALAGNVERAEQHLAEYLTVEPGMTVRRFAEERSSVPLDPVSPVYQHETERILEGLRRAGMPDETDGPTSRSPRSETIRPEAVRGTSRTSAGDASEPISELIGRETELSDARPARVHHLGADRVRGEPICAAQPSLALPDKPSIAVLSFANMTGDPEQEYFVDGMVEEIITALSRIRWLFVIARNSSFTYKGQTVDVKQVGRELGVRYVLEGSVRKAGGRVRITGQLIDAVTGTHLWADHFDGSLEDVFDLQDKVASSVAGVIEPALQAAETARSAGRPTADLTAYDLYLRAYAMVWSSARQIPEALRLIEQAIERDPRYGPALAWAAYCCYRLLRDDRSEDREADRLKGVDFAQRAVEVAGDDPGVLAHAAQALAYFGEDIGAMMALVDRALALNPNYARGWVVSGILRYWAGQLDIAIEHVEASLRLSPRARIGTSRVTIGAAHFVGRRFDLAVPKLLLAIQEYPSFPNPYRLLAACYAHMGRLDDAREVVRRLRSITPAVIPDVSFLRNAEHRELWLSGLRLATGEAT